MQKTLKHIPYTTADFKWVTWGKADVEKAGRDLISELNKIYTTIKSVPEKERTFANTIFPLDTTAAMIHNLQNTFMLIKSVSTDKTLRDFVTKESTALSEKLIECIYDKEVYAALLSYKKRSQKLDLSESLLVKDFMLGYKRMGFDLSNKLQDKLKKNMKDISKLVSQFSKNVNDYHDHITVTKDQLKGMSNEYIATLKKQGSKYQVSLAYPEVFPFLENADDASKRKELALKNLQKGGKKNMVILNKILALRKESANMLGYKHHADYAMEVRMAKDLKTAHAFVTTLLGDLAPIVKKEYQELLAYKQKDTHTKKAKLEFYDGAYYVNKMLKEQYSVDNEALRAYFPFKRVKDKTLEIYAKLLSLTFKKVAFPTWHEDVEWYQVSDKGGDLLGYFVMDLYPRQGKYGHACAVDIVKPHILAPGGKLYQTPVSAMIANFPKPLQGQPSLLSHGEVETFFHEFGHLMHSLVTTANYASQSGFSTAWDFVEIPSQLFEEWVWDKNILKDMSGHYKNEKEKIPDELLERLIKSKNFRRATWTTGQLTSSLFDLDIHSKKISMPLNLYSNALIKKYYFVQRPKEAIHPASFGHIVDGYDAGYYSYIWSLVYAHDVFTRFKKEGIMNTKTGRDLRDKILAMGGSIPEMKLLENFLGRKPNNKAFLKELGL